MSNKSRTITIDGQPYTVIDNLGWQPGAGVYVKEVMTPEGPRKAVRPPGGKAWRWWTVSDRTSPLFSKKVKP